MVLISLFPYAILTIVGGAGSRSTITDEPPPLDPPRHILCLPCEYIPVLAKEPNEHRLVHYPQGRSDIEYLGLIPLTKGNTRDFVMWLPLLGSLLRNL
ncbi:hypothetical protein LIER_19059 [Lithospermum erythrorhizon]|uniref:Uncharacterized protein n=1 Tax=Lithospermum erythrorhizon TaxID=34254 RepID=A0AAV3QLR2_LITER